MTTASPTSHLEQLQRLEVLRAYKQVFAGDGTANLSPFSDDRVVRLDADVDAWDIPEIHHDVRLAILDNLAELHHGKSSRVVILAGQPGMGKSHLLNHFRAPPLQDEHGYVFVGNNNFWKVEEFEPYLLTWLVAALVRPGPQGPNLLLDKISDLSFQALEQVLDRPGQINNFLAHQAGMLGRFVNRFRARHVDFHKACQQRDVAIFRRLDFHRFADFVCDRFLHDRTNPFHRFVLYVLLRYLFPEDRAKVCAWLIGQKVHDVFFQSLGGPYRTRREEPTDPDWPSEDEVQALFQKEFGISDRLNLNFKMIDTLKILISLFSPEVNRHIGRSDEHAGRIFFFAFDQPEGRNELFDKYDDWFRFFAKLSELYNTLPNVFIVFTMTLGLRDKLYTQMESQFQQRISKDQKFLLHAIDDREIVAMYRRRLELWRAGRVPGHIEDALADPALELLPFDQEEVLRLAHEKSSHSVRAMLDAFDQHFRACMNGLVVEAAMDFHVAANELTQQPFGNLFEFTRGHLDSVQHLLDRVPDRIAEPFGLTLNGADIIATEDGVPTLKLEFSSPASNGKWVRIFLALLPHRYRSKLPGCGRLLFNLERNRNFLWLIRPGPTGIDLDGQFAKKEEQVFTRLLDLKAEAHLQALILLLNKQQLMVDEAGQDEEDKNRYRGKVDEILAGEIKLMYLGEMFQHAAEALERLSEGGEHDGD